MLFTLVGRQVQFTLMYFCQVVTHNQQIFLSVFIHPLRDESSKELRKFNFIDWLVFCLKINYSCQWLFLSFLQRWYVTSSQLVSVLLPFPERLKKQGDVIAPDHAVIDYPWNWRFQGTQQKVLKTELVKSRTDF